MYVGVTALIRREAPWELGGGFYYLAPGRLADGTGSAVDLIRSPRSIGHQLGSREHVKKAHSQHPLLHLPTRAVVPDAQGGFGEHLRVSIEDAQPCA